MGEEEREMIVKLLDATSLTLAAKAAKMCIGKEWGGGDEAAYLKTLIQRGHESVLEHVVYVFEVQGLSRACLQQLARHRHISLSVKSTRWALKEHAAYYIPPEMLNEDRDEYVRRVEDMIEYGKRLGSKYGNDVGKYPLPECLQTDLILTLNLRELRHIYKLRTGRTAMLEFQHLAKELVACLPEDEQDIVRYRSDALERAVQEYLESGSDEDRVRMEALVE